MIKIQEVEAKSALVKSKIPSADYVINPYGGCAFGCSYCYAIFMRKFSGHLDDRWGQYVDVKINAPLLLRKQISNIYKRKNLTSYPSIIFGSVTDPYQGVEAKYKITQQCLKVLADFKYPGQVSLLTKSPLVIRDVEIIKKVPQISVGLTITSLDDPISNIIEKSAPPSSVRLHALKTLNQNNISTYVFIGPLLPHFVTTSKALETLVVKIKEAGTKEIWFEHLNLSPYIQGRLKEELKGKIKDQFFKKFYLAKNPRYKEKLNQLITALVKKYDLQLGYSSVITHS